MTANPAVLPLYRHCGICDAKENLLRCGRCKMIQYCSNDHQSTDWPNHKSSCSAITKKRNKLDQEEQDLYNTPDDGFMTNGDPFVNDVGHFWGMHHTRPYMTARFAYVDTILKIKTLDASICATDNFLDMLRLCRGDNMGVRSLVPAQLLRQGKDRQCYDFIKWWATVGQDSNYDWGDTDLPYLDLKDADVFESVDLLCHEYADLSHTVSVTLLKLRLLLAIKKCLQGTSVLAERGSLPQEVLDYIQDITLKSLVAEKWGDIGSTQGPQLLDTISSQVDELYDSVKRLNKHFWPALLEPGNHLSAHPMPYSMGSVPEMHLALQYCYDSWRESPGAIEFIKSKR